MQDATIGQLALLVTRESKEYRNVFHMMTDLFNTFLTLRMVGLGSPADPPRMVVLLDNNPEGPLDGLWAGVAASGGLPGLEAPYSSTGIGGTQLKADVVPEVVLPCALLDMRLNQRGLLTGLGVIMNCGRYACRGGLQSACDPGQFLL